MRARPVRIAEHVFLTMKEILIPAIAHHMSLDSIVKHVSMDWYLECYENYKYGLIQFILPATFQHLINLILVRSL